MDHQRNAGTPRERATSRAESQQSNVDGNARRTRTTKEQRWPGTVMAIGLLGSLYVLMWLGRRTFIEPVLLFRGLALFCLVGTLLPYAWSGLRLGMEKLEWFLFNVLAVGPVSVSMLLLVNHYLHGPVRWSEAHLGYDIKVVIDEADGPVEHRLPGQGYFYFTEDELDAATSGRYRVGVAKGCLGYWTVTDVELMP